MSHRWGMRGFAALVATGMVGVSVAWAAPAAEESHHAHEAAAMAAVSTDDPVLKEQIAKVDQALAQIHEQMAQSRQVLQQATTEAQRASLYGALDGLRKEHDMLERLLHELVEEATATEWTKIDEALKRARSFERSQEKAYQQEETVRERKTQ